MTEADTPAPPPATGDQLRARAAILQAVRAWFVEHGYLEVQPPTIVPSAAMEEHLEAVRVGAWRTREYY